jgi:hypothetical protein
VLEEIRPGLTTWTAPHPSWTPDAEGWDQEVRSYAPARPYRHGDTLPGRVEALVGGYPEEATLWIPACGGLVVGDVFLGGALGSTSNPTPGSLTA